MNGKVYVGNMKVGQMDVERGGKRGKPEDVRDCRIGVRGNGKEKTGHFSLYDLSQYHCHITYFTVHLVHLNNQSFSGTQDILLMCYFLVYRWNFPEGRPVSNFDTFTNALLTVFQVILTLPAVTM